MSDKGLRGQGTGEVVTRLGLDVAAGGRDLAEMLHSLEKAMTRNASHYLYELSRYLVSTMKTLSTKEMITVYRILKLLDEGLLGHLQEEWEQEDYDEGPITGKDIKPLIRKLKAAIPKEERKKIDKEIMISKYSGFNRGPDEQIYAILEKAFDGERIVKVEYFSPARAEVTRRKIAIYYLSRKYIIAYCHKREDIRKFRADRFISAKPTKEKYTIPKDFDKKQYL